MEETLTIALLAQGSITAQIADRLSWQLRPQGKGLPALCLHLISRPRTYHMAGEDSVSPGRVQVNCLAATRAQAKALADAVIAYASGLTALSGISVIHCDDERDLPPDHQADAVTFGRAVDLLIWASA